MNFKKYAESLNKLLAKHPEAGEFDVVISIDDDGDTYMKVDCYPSIGALDENDGFDSTEENLGQQSSCVCLNYMYFGKN